jgi:hypothetical protein
MPVLVIDSIQTLASRIAEEGVSERAALTATMTLLGEVKKLGVIVIATSELARGAYASQDPGQRTRALAGFAESRSIEYQSDIAAVMTRATGEGDLARLEVLKNRLGHKKGSMTLRLDHARARFVEMDQDVVERHKAERERREAEEKISADDGRVLAVLEQLPPEVRPRGLAAEDVRVRAAMSKPVCLAALARLEDSGRVEKYEPARIAGQQGRAPKLFRLPGRASGGGEK